MRRLWWMVPVALCALAAGCGRREAKPPAGVGAKIAWITDPGAAFAQAKTTGKLVMMDLWQAGCKSCDHLDAQVWARPEVAKMSKQFVAAKVSSEKYKDLPPKYSVSGYPTTLFLTAEGKEVMRVRGAPLPEDMIAAMRLALRKAPSAK